MKRLSPRRPGRRQWSGLWTPCPICYETMDLLVIDGQKVYECPDCVREFGERQLELFEGGVAALAPPPRRGTMSGEKLGPIIDEIERHMTGRDGFGDCIACGADTMRYPHADSCPIRRLRVEIARRTPESEQGERELARRLWRAQALLGLEDAATDEQRDEAYHIVKEVVDALDALARSPTREEPGEPEPPLPRDVFAHLAWTTTLYDEIETAWSDEDSAYLARWKALPSCGLMVDGDTREDAVRDLIAATETYMQVLIEDLRAPREPQGGEGGALAKIDRALDMVAALCKPRGAPDKREWIMSIPARPDYDPDIVIADALIAARDALRSGDSKGREEWFPLGEIRVVCNAAYQPGSEKVGDVRMAIETVDGWLKARGTPMPDKGSVGGFVVPRGDSRGRETP